MSRSREDRALRRCGGFIRHGGERSLVDYFGTITEAHSIHYNINIFGENYIKKIANSTAIFAKKKKILKNILQWHFMHCSSMRNERKARRVKCFGQIMENGSCG